MDLLELMASRRSVRAYRADEVEAEKLQKILEAARLAPTACNLQAFRVVVMKTAGRQQELARVYHRPWLSEGPYVLAVCVEKGAFWVRKDGRGYGDVDASIVMDHIILEATALGLGTCWVGAFDAAAAAEVFGLGDAFEPLVLTPLGYPADEGRERVRKPLSEVVLYR